MIDYEYFCKIKQLKEDGLFPSQIARELRLDPRTVYKWIAEERFRQRKSSRRSSKLDPFKNEILQMLQTHPYSAIQILQRIRERGFDGGYTILREFIKKYRPKKTQAFLTLSFAPGECAQVDWGSFGSVNVGNTRRRLSFFVMVLCYSRMLYVEFTVSQTMEHFLACHQNAFQYFNAVPGKIMVDNLKSAVLRRKLGQEPVFNPRYRDFADHYGFTIAPCNVGKGNEKGRVENAVGYVKKNFLAGLEITDFNVVNPAAKVWMETIANIRVHGSTRIKPLELMEKERPHLRSLPPHPFDCANCFQVRASSQFRVTLDTNRYSVPAQYAGIALTLKAYPDRICIYHKGELIARHTRTYDRHRDIEDPDHPKPLLAERKRARDQKIFIRFLALSNRAEDYYLKLEQRRMNPALHVRRIVALSEIYAPEDVARAMDDAFEYQAFSSEYIANLLEQRKRLKPEAGALYLTRREDLLELSIEKPNLNLYDFEKERT